MHVTLINTHYAPDLVGGAERSLQVLAHSLRDRGHRVSTICLATSTGSGRAEVDGVEVVYLPSPELYWSSAPDQRYPWRGLPGWVKPFWHFRETWNRQQQTRIAEALKHLQPDLVHTNNLLGLSAGCWDVVKSQGLPLVHTLRDYQLLCPRGQMMKGSVRCDHQCAACRAYSLPRRGPSKMVDAVIGNSEFILRRHRQYGLFEGVKIAKAIYNAWHAQDAALRRSSARGGVLRLGFMGNLTEAKGLPQMLASLRPLLVQDRVRVSVAGTGDAEFVVPLKQQYSTNVEFLGWTSSEELLDGVDMLVVPSLWEEPLSRTIFEAYRRGVPVLASCRGGHPEVVDQGVSGYCYEPDSADELALIVQQFVEHPNLLERLSQGAQAAAERFSPQRLAGEHLALYERVLDASGSVGSGISSDTGSRSKTS